MQQLTKVKPQILSVEQHSLKLTAQEPEVLADVTTELQWQWAMQRRGIALDQCGLIAWDTYQKWLQQLLGLDSKEVPAGYVRVQMEQLIAADREQIHYHG